MSKKNNTSVQDKMDMLEPLSCGIVYGKEETWEKLQGRLEQKKKRIPVVYWAAAACIVISISVCVMVFMFRQPVVISSNIPATNHQELNTIHIAQNDTQIQNTEKEQPKSANNLQIFRNTTANIKYNKKLPVDSTPAIKKETVVNDTQLQQLSIPDTKIKQLTPAMTSAQILKQMKVVHINELDKVPTPVNISENFVQNKPTYFNNKLPVLHINNLNIRKIENTQDNNESVPSLRIALKNPFSSNSEFEKVYANHFPLNKIFNTQK